MKWPFQKKRTEYKRPAWAVDDGQERVYADHMAYATVQFAHVAMRIASVIPVNYVARRCQIGKIRIKPKA